MTLAEGKVKNDYYVEEIRSGSEIRERLAALGIVNGARIRLLNRKKDGAAVLFVRGTRVAVGKEIVKNLFVAGAKI